MKSNSAKIRAPQQVGRRMRAWRLDCDQVSALGTTSRERILFAPLPFPQILVRRSAAPYRQCYENSSAETGQSHANGYPGNGVPLTTRPLRDLRETRIARGPEYFRG